MENSDAKTTLTDKETSNMENCDEKTTLIDKYVVMVTKF